MTYHKGSKVRLNDGSGDVGTISETWTQFSTVAGTTLLFMRVRFDEGDSIVVSEREVTELGR